jgi:AhpD family alkylhydroperoxidase
MTRDQVYQEMMQLLGVVPGFFKEIPDNTIGLEWELFKKLQIEENALSAKEKELIGLGIAAITKCKYCAYYHTQFAKLFGATNAEIEDALHFAKAAAGWSAYINGQQADFEQFKREIDQVCAHVRQALAVAA